MPSLSLLRKPAFAFGACTGVLLLSIIILVVILNLDDTDQSHGSSSSYFTPCDNPGRSSILAHYTQSAVSSDAAPCATVAKYIMKRNGTAADAAIAAMFCVGVINAQSSGLGGGFVATYYSKKERKAYCLDAREVAPKAATGSMYDSDPKAASQGGLSVAVPGEVAGLYELYKRFGGGVLWQDLLKPAIKLCEEGYNLTWYTAGIIKSMESHFLKEQSLRPFTVPSEDRVLGEGETVFRKQLGRTLRIIQKDPDQLQRGPLAAAFVQDLTQFGGIITNQDMEEYRPKWRAPVHWHLRNGNYNLFSFPPPGSGLVLGLILKVLDALNLSASALAPDEVLNTQMRAAEAFKHSYALRSRLGDLPDDVAAQLIQELTDEKFAALLSQNISTLVTSQDPLYYGTQVVPGADDGTAHLSLIAPDGDAVAITSSINYAFGARMRSPTTGIIYNNQMKDFSPDRAAASPGTMEMSWNRIKPGRRPLSSMSPTVITNANGDVKLVVGAAGGVKIPSASAWVAARYLWMGENLKAAVDACRTHHPLIPMKLQYEMGFPKDLVNALKRRGHTVKEYKWKSVVEVVGREADGTLVANSDYRKSGQVDGF